MAFTASTFIYNGIKSESFGLYLYSFNNKSQGNGSFGGEGKILENRLQSRYRPLHYGVSRNSPMEFTIVFGTLDTKPIDRKTAAKIAEWLIGHQQYQWLSICQSDMEHVRYRCLIDDLVQLPVRGNTIAFQANVKCDGPYAYHLPESVSIKSSGTATGKYQNESNIHDKYYPSMKIEIKQGEKNIEIWTDKEPERKFILSNLSISAPTNITIDGENQVITGGDTNWYRHCNMKFLRLWPGENTIHVNGNCSVTLDCQPPVNIGF